MKAYGRHEKLNCERLCDDFIVDHTILVFPFLHSSLCNISFLGLSEWEENHVIVGHEYHYKTNQPPGWMLEL